MWFDVQPAFVPADRASVQQHPRVLFSIPITLHHLGKDGIRKTRGISLDISEHGLGAIVPGDLQVGETVEIDLCLGERSLSAIAIVRHSSHARSGFEFLGLTAEQRLQIAGVVGSA
jgi:hypothetical protein